MSFKGVKYYRAVEKTSITGKIANLGGAFLQGSRRRHPLDELSDRISEMTTPPQTNYSLTTTWSWNPGLKLTTTEYDPRRAVTTTRVATAKFSTQEERDHTMETLRYQASKHYANPHIYASLSDIVHDKGLEAQCQANHFFQASLA